MRRCWGRRICWGVGGKCYLFHGEEGKRDGVWLSDMVDANAMYRLILQHQEQLGNKRIGAITVWDSSGFAGSGGVFQLSVMVEIIART